MKKTIYVDMDNVIVDFPSAFPHIDEQTKEEFKNDMDEIDGIFALMQPLPFAIPSVHFLARHFELFVLSTAPWENPSAWKDKLLWIKKHLPKVCYKRLILSHNKHLNQGHYLIDDRLKNGVDRFRGEHIHFGQEGVADWQETIHYICQEESLPFPSAIFEK